MFIKATGIDDKIYILNADRFETVEQHDDKTLKIYYAERYIYIKGDLDEFYQRLVKTDRKDQY